MKKISILGSTGSIGLNALKIASEHRSKIRVVALGAGHNINLLLEQILDFEPYLVSVALEENAIKLKDMLKSHPKGKWINTQIVFGDAGLIEVAKFDDAQMVLIATDGSTALNATVAAIKAKKDIALATKEVLVMAGNLITKLAKENNVKIIPVDSEHSAIYRCLKGVLREELKTVILTASGGPFYNKEIDFDKVSKEEALSHPNWKMGKKITIDSSTMMNKGLEIIEAKWLFNLKPEQIDIVIHPESIIHSMVQTKDNSILAQMSMPDMKGPIGYAFFNENVEGYYPIKPLNFLEIGSLTFGKPDKKKFPLLQYAIDAMIHGPWDCISLNAANDVAVSAFLNGIIKFSEIHKVVIKTLDTSPGGKIRWGKSEPGDLESVWECDRLSRTKAEQLLGR